MGINYNAEIKELAVNFIPGSDENWTGYNPDEQAKLMPKIIHQAKRFIKKWDEEHKTSFEADIEGITKDTLYNALKNMPAINLVVMLNGYVQPKEIKEIIDKGIHPDTKKYRYAMDEGEKLIEEAWLPTVSQIRELHNSGMVNSRYTLPSEKMQKVLNGILSDTDLPPIDELLRELATVETYKDEAKDALKTLDNRQKEFEEELARLREVAANVSQVTPMTDFNVAPEGDLPEGQMVMRKASEIFDMEFEKDFELPTFDWEHDHPQVPAVDPHYIFRKRELVRVLYAIMTNQRAYLQGHTGSGKTTLIEQVAAHLKFPFIRINFDSEITRMDLIGRDTLYVDDDGNTKSRFVDGLLPQAMSGPCIACFDELDFVRPDVAYVMQAATEGNGLRITEDGGREVKPHPLFRMFATGNTVGQGDEEGMYQGARMQSMALLDRFTIWVNVPYLDEKQRTDLLTRHCPVLTREEVKTIIQYSNEHLEAFLNNKILQPISPRGILAVGQATQALGDLNEALSMTILHRANQQDRAVIKGIIDRVCG